MADRTTLIRALSIPGVARLVPVQSASPSLDHSVPFILGGESYAGLGADGTGTRIAAGLGTSKVAHGVAPGASLLIYKVFALGSTSSANVAAAIEMAVDPNGDGDTSDHVDVINMSLGSPYGRNTDLTAVASNAAAALGTIVVASAGNSGNNPYFAGSPAVASDAISVAAGNDPGVP